MSKRPILLQDRHHHPGLHNPSPICHILTVCSIPPHLPSVPHYCRADTIIQGYTIQAQSVTVIFTVCYIPPHVQASHTTAEQTPSSRATQSKPNLSHLNCLFYHSTSPQRPPLLQGRHHHPGLHNPSPICHILTVCSIPPHLPSVPHYCRADTIIQGYTIPAQSVTS